METHTSEIIQHYVERENQLLQQSHMGAWLHL